MEDCTIPSAASKINARPITVRTMLKRKFVKVTFDLGVLSYVAVKAFLFENSQAEYTKNTDINAIPSPLPKLPSRINSKGSMAIITVKTAEV